MRLQRCSNGQIISLDLKSTLGHGGEARVYALLEDERVVAKIYHQPTHTCACKLATMIANPPKDPTAERWHISIAWPIDMLQTVDSDRRVVGFLMPRVKAMYPIFDFYNPRARSQKSPFFNYRYLHRTASNLAAAIGALHSRGYCIGDVNESNILVSNIALVTLVDADSFQARDLENDIVYHCCVGKPEFTPPELQGKSFRLVERMIEHDLFGLAVLIFQLLMEGTHPFSGIFQGVGDPPPYSVRIASGHFPYSTARRGPYIPTTIAPPFEILHPTLQELFVRCFEDGHYNPLMRPSTHTWQRAIIEAEKALVVCPANSQHRYGNHLNACPWCERTHLLGGRDPFPSLKALQQKQHLQSKQKQVKSVVGHCIQVDFIQSGCLQPAPRSAIIMANRNFRLFALSLLGICGCEILVVFLVTWNLNFAPNSNASFFPRSSNTISPKQVTGSTKGYGVSYDKINNFYKFNKYKEAIEKYSQVLRSNPHEAKAYVNRGDAHYKIAQHSGNPDQYYRQAIEDLNAALHLNPDDAEAYLKRGVVRYEIAQYSKNPDEDYKEAIEDLSAAVRLNPGNAKAFIKRGIVHYKHTQHSRDFNRGYKAAIEDFDSALRRNFNDAEAYLNRAIVYYEIAQNNSNFTTGYSKAVADLQKAANLFLEQGDIAHYLQAIEICRRERLDSRCQ